MSVQRRPRIPNDLAAEIDAVRGREPFDSFVRYAVGEYIHFFCSHGRGNHDSRYTGSTPEATVLMQLAFSDLFQLDLKAFDAAVAEAREKVTAELDRQAVEDEHMDPDVI